MTDSTLTRSLKGLFTAFLALVALIAIVLLASWLWPLSKVQKNALAALQSTAQDMPGRNAYTALVTLGLEGLTPEQRQARVDAFIPRYSRWQKTSLSLAVNGKKSDDTTAGDAPKLLMEDEQEIKFDQRLCSFNEAAGCLDKARGQPEAIASALAAQENLLHRISQLSSYGHSREPEATMPGISSPIAPVRLLATPLAAHARAYLQGNIQGAMEGLCRDAATGRMLMTHTDLLIYNVIGGAMLAANAKELASILSELPNDVPLPEACTAAFAPPTPFELSTCTAMRGEFKMQAALFHSQKEEFQKAGLRSIFLNEEKTSARNAEVMGWACLPANLEAIAEDRKSVPDSAAYPRLERLECVTNYLGCVLSMIAAPTYGEYVVRLQDVGAQLRLLQAVLWLREHADEMAGQPLSQRLQALPPALRQGPRTITVSEDGRALQLPSYSSTTKGKPLSMPVPAELTERG